MVRHAHKHKWNIFSKARVYVLYDDQWAISRRLRWSIAAILRAIFSQWHDYDRDVGDQWTAKCERRLIQAKKNVWTKRVVICCSRVTYQLATMYRNSKI